MPSDVLVLGATGFTGSLVVEYIAKFCEDVTWTIAARSMKKIEDLVGKLKAKGVDVMRVPTRVVDVTDNESLYNALRNAKLVLNCVGPYTNLSEPIVEACIKLGVHYIDVSAEVNHILKLYIKYHKLAEDSNVLIIPSCGFASMLTASGLLYLQKEFGGSLRSAECYTELSIPKKAYIPYVTCLVSYGTWDSLVHVMRNLKESLRWKEDTFPAVELPTDMKRNFFHWRQRKLWFPYPGPDENVIHMSQRYLQEKKHQRPVHFKHYVTMPLLIHFLIIPAMFLYYYLSYFNCFAKLLRKFPRFFTLGYMSHKGPTDKAREDTKYTFTYVGKGWEKREGDMTKAPDKVIEAKMSSNDPYGITALVMITAAITLLKEQPRMPSGGVVNVGAAFNETTIVDRLMNNGIKYDMRSTDTSLV